MVKNGTDDPDGGPCVFAKKPAGEYTAATERWIEGKGKVVVRP